MSTHVPAPGRPRTDSPIPGDPPTSYGSPTAAALALYELAPSRSHEIHLTLSRERRPRTPRPAGGVALHTTTVPLRRDEVATRFGVQITSPARTITDVADIGADPSVVIAAAGRALASGLVSPGELHVAVAHRSARARRLVERAVEEAGTRA